MNDLVKKIKEMDARAACMHRGLKALVLVECTGEDELSKSIMGLAREEPKQFRKKMRKLVERFEQEAKE